MPALITTLIDKLDTNEIVRNKIASILATEEANQRVLATDASKDPNLWKFSVFIERAKPWLVLTDNNGSEIGEMPLVNVSFDNDSFDNKGSANIGFQKARGIFYIDCYATKNRTISMTGDEASSKEADRIARLVRNIIMHGNYTYLDLRQTVTRRFITRREKLQPDIKMEGLENVIVSRISVEVEYEEYTNQGVPVTMEQVFGQCKVSDTSQVYFDSNFIYAD
jgi:hypothetical protein